MSCLLKVSQRDVLGIVTSCPCAVWSRGLTTCGLVHFGKSITNVLVYKFDRVDDIFIIQIYINSN